MSIIRSITLRENEIKFVNKFIWGKLGLHFIGKISGFGFCIRIVTSTEPIDAGWQQIVDAVLSHDTKRVKLNCMPHISTCFC
jgi:hypothetical protein